MRGGRQPSSNDIAASRTGGLTPSSGTMVKATHPGNTARMDAEAAMLAHVRGHDLDPRVGTTLDTRALTSAISASLAYVWPSELSM
jgi:hypothetical protein